MTSNQADDSTKSHRLRKFVAIVFDGKRAIKDTKDAKLFFEAVCNQEDRVGCIEKMVASSHGLQALKLSLRCDDSDAFMNDTASAFLAYIDGEDLKQVHGGQLLREVLSVVVEPPTFWNALEKKFEQRLLSPIAVYGFAWLLLELLTSPPGFLQLPVFQVAKKVIASLLDSSNAKTRSVAYRIQDVLRTTASGALLVKGKKPGGRHDNDFEDFRNIAIFPTADELNAKATPFYVQADVIRETDPEKRAAAHLDNQFRLLREEMLGELRADLQIARGKKQARRVVRRLKNLAFHSIDNGGERRRRPASIALRCYGGINVPPGTADERKKYLVQNTKTVLKHDSFGCLLCSNEIVSFATIDRNEELLAQDTPILLLRILGTSAIVKTLVSLKTTPQQEIEFVMVETPFFAYEPILRSLQEKTSIPLSDELLGLVEKKSFAKSPICPEKLVTRIQQHEGSNLRKILNLQKDVVLDHSQTTSLIAGLSQTVSLIQGPPGETSIHFSGGFLLTKRL